jgi:hypothetical protein
MALVIPGSASRFDIDDVNGLHEVVARDAQATFGGLDVRHLNWRPDATRWSVAQCFEHLVMANRLMLQQARDALEKGPTNIWQRVPFMPGLFGLVLIRSQAPGAARKFTASPKAQPATGDVPADVIERFAEQHRDASAWMRALAERDAGRAIMTSPFGKVVTYSVLDGCRLIVAHDHRHFEQARRVTQAPGFPGA